jgi:membrane protease YdiL (CAAX protease family)
MERIQGVGIRFTVPGYLLLLLIQFVLSGLVILWARGVDGWTLADLRIARPAWRPVGLGLLTGAIYSGGCVLWSLGHSQGVERVGADVPLGSLLAWAAPSLLVMLPMNSLKEELLFRAYAVGRLQRRGTIYAALVSSVLFALSHFVGEPPTPWRALTLVLFGLLCAFLFLRTGTLWSVVALHSSWNAGFVLFSGNVQVGGLFRYVQEAEGPWNEPFRLLLVAACFAAVQAATQSVRGEAKRAGTVVTS